MSVRPSRTGSRSRWYAWGFVATAAVTAATLTASNAYAAAQPEWTVTPTPGMVVPSWFRAVDALAEDDVWAVGGVDNAATAAHWDGRSWQRVEVPAGFDLTDVDAVSPREAWAVGIDQDDRARTIHWDGVRWSDAGSPVPPGERLSVMEAVVARSARDVWVAGGYHHGRVPYVAHWDGRDWAYHQIPLPANAHRVVINDLAVTEHGEVLVSGAAVRPDPDSPWYRAEPWLARFDGTQWAADVALPDLGSPTGYVSALLPSGHAGIWLAGYVDDDGQPRPVLLNWKAGRWTVVPMPTVAGYISGIARDGQGRLLLAGAHEDWETRTMVLLRYDGTAVTVQQPPAAQGVLLDVAAVPHSSTTWLVGITGNPPRDMQAWAAYSSCVVEDAT